MTRVKSLAARRHRKLRKLTHGYKQARRRRVKAGKEAFLHAGQYAYAGRKLRKRDMRSLWIERLNASARLHNISYNKLISGLKKANILIDRKILSDIAVNDPKTFEKIISEIK